MNKKQKSNLYRTNYELTLYRNQKNLTNNHLQMVIHVNSVRRQTLALLFFHLHSKNNTDRKTQIHD